MTPPTCAARGGVTNRCAGKSPLRKPQWTYPHTPKDSIHDPLNSRGPRPPLAPAHGPDPQQHTRRGKVGKWAGGEGGRVGGGEGDRWGGRLGQGWHLQCLTDFSWGKGFAKPIACICSAARGCSHCHRHPPPALPLVPPPLPAPVPPPVPSPTHSRGGRRGRFPSWGHWYRSPSQRLRSTFPD